MPEATTEQQGTVVAHVRGDDAVAPTRRTVGAGALDVRSLVDLQRRAGNSAVRSLLLPATTPGRPTRSRAPAVARPPFLPVQRAPLPKAQDPQGYTQPQGVGDVARSGMTRVEVHDLAYGITGGFKPGYRSRKGAVTPGVESRMTKESPDRMAVLLVPDVVVRGAGAAGDTVREHLRKEGLQVLLHFHGFGFRKKDDPYAGYTVASGELAAKGARGTVRDVDQEQWPQQIGKVSGVSAVPAAPSGPLIVAILAQGRGRSEFGDFPTSAYVADVLTKSSIPLLQGVPYSVVLSGHSGGGSRVAHTLRREPHPLAPRPAPGSTGAAGPQALPGLVVLFDAEGVEGVTDWVLGQVRDLAAGTRAAATRADAQKLIDASPRFRGYFDAKGLYKDRYHAQNERLGAELRKVPVEHTRQDTAAPRATKVEDLFRFVAVSGAGVGHEHVISGGKDGDPEAGMLADALRASRDPLHDRAQALPFTTGPRRSSSSRQRTGPRPPTGRRAVTGQ